MLDGLVIVTLDMSIGGVSRVYPDAYRLPERMAVGDPSDAAYLQRMVEWHLPTTGVAIDPRPGDTITDAGAVIWIIQTVRPPEFGDFWGLDCLESTITADPALADKVSLWTTTDVIDGFGGKATTFTRDPALRDIDAKIVLRESVPVTEMGQRDFVEQYDIYVDTDLGTLRNGDQVRDDVTGDIYTIVSWRNRFQIDELSVIECEDKIAGS